MLLGGWWPLNVMFTLTTLTVNARLRVLAPDASKPHSWNAS